MQILTETSLRNFKFWSGAKDHRFTLSELDQLEDILSDIEQPLEATHINDYFWFEEELLCEWLNIDFNEDYLNR